VLAIFAVRTSKVETPRIAQFVDDKEDFGGFPSHFDYHFTPIA
jgi:hypothetical protein